MAPSPFLVPCLVELRSEFNALNPNRDKGADGWIGDTAHQDRPSDHNPDSQGRVLAIDIDVTGPWPDGADLATAVSFLVGRCKSGAETRLEYVIFSRKIYSRDSNWNAANYTGTDPHTNHAHFSARHDHTGQNNTGAWGIEELDMPTPAEYAQAVASKLHADLVTPTSGLAKDVDANNIDAAQVFASKLFADLADDGTTDPNGDGQPSGIHTAFSAIIDKRLDAKLAPLQSTMDAILAAVDGGTSNPNPPNQPVPGA